MARRDPKSQVFLDKMFNLNGIWFIENVGDGKWLTESHDWTNDPLKAKVFANHPRGFIYAKKLKLVSFAVTEHKFVNDKKEKDE